MLENKIEEKSKGDKLSDKIAKKKNILKSKIKPLENMPKQLTSTVWYASILF